MPMTFHRSLLLTLFIIIYCTLTTSVSFIKRSSEGAHNIQDLSKNIQESIGILPIGEIIRKAKLPQLIYSISTEEEEACNSTSTEMVTITELTTKRSSKNSIVKTLLKGSTKDIAKIPYKKIIKNLEYINRLNLPLHKKLAIWNTIKTNKTISEMNREYLTDLQELLNDIPESEFIQFNTDDWDIVDFFGTSKWLTRRRAAIIAYAMKHRYGETIIYDLQFINKLKGLICGFSQSDLKKISTSIFQDIHQSVFTNLWPCTSEQMIILLATAQKPEVYGLFELWNEHVLRKIGLLVTVIKVEEFDKFHFDTFNGLEPNIMNMMSDDQRQWLSERKLEYKSVNH